MKNKVKALNLLTRISDIENFDLADKIVLMDECGETSAKLSPAERCVRSVNAAGDDIEVVILPDYIEVLVFRKDQSVVRNRFYRDGQTSSQSVARWFSM